MVILWFFFVKKGLHYSDVFKPPPPGDKGGFWGKKVEKKMKILHAGVILEKNNKILKILHEGISIDHFQKVPFFTDI